MKKDVFIGSCLLASAALLLGAGPFVADNTDLLRVRGEGKAEVVNGTLLHEHFTNGEWITLFSRNSGSLKIEVSAPEGTYYVETWSIPTDPMNPQRVHQGQQVVIGEAPDDSLGMEDLLALIDAWGPCSGACPYDLNGDGVVDIYDLLHLLGNW